MAFGLERFGQCGISERAFGWRRGGRHRILGIVATAILAGMTVTVATPLAAGASVSWIVQFSVGQDEYAYGVSLDQGAAVYVTGTVLAADWEAFVAKRGLDGSPIWSVTFGATGASDAGRWISVIGGSIYVVGETGGALPGWTNQGGTDIFARKYNSDSTVAWTIQTGTTANDWAYGVVTDESGLYISGVTDGASLGGGSAGGRDAWIMKLNLNGGPVEAWQRQFGTAGNEDGPWGGGSSIALAGGLLFVAGTTTGVFDGQTASGGQDIFVRRYDLMGNAVWTRQFGIKHDDNFKGIAADSSGIYVTADFREWENVGGLLDGVVRKYDALGNEMWSQPLQIPLFTERLGGPAADASGVSVVGGTYGQFPGQTSSGGLDAFVRRYDTSGNLRWTSQFGTSSSDQLYAASGMPSSGLYVVGRTEGSFPGYTRVGASDTFLAKVQLDDPPQPLFTYYPSSPKIGQLVEFDASETIDPEGGALTFRWDFEGDGLWDTGASTDPTARHTYWSSGSFQATLRVSDGINSVSFSQTVNVVSINTPRALTIQISGELDFKLEESIYLQVTALVTDASNALPVSGATVTVELWRPRFFSPPNPPGLPEPWECDPGPPPSTICSMREDIMNSGIYQWISPANFFAATNNPQGIWLVRVRASWPGPPLGPEAVAIMQFHVDPPGAQTNGHAPFPWELMITTGLAVALLTAFWKRDRIALRLRRLGGR